MGAIGFLELSSIAKGIESADTMLKASSTLLLFSRAICPGKYAVMISGAVSDVKLAISVGQESAAEFVIDSLVIPRVSEQVIQAIRAATEVTEVSSIGVMEFYSITAAVHAADTAVKATNVCLLDMRLGTGIGGKSFVVISGEVSAVDEAIKCGVAAVKETGYVVTSVVIPNPCPEVISALL